MSEDVDYFENSYPEGVYDSADPEVRNIIPWNTINECPLQDGNGYEIPWFTRDGLVIKRRAGIFTTRTQPHGILFDLPKLADLFIDDDDLFGERPIKYHVYPQAGLRSIGHFQAQGIMSPFKTLLEGLNHKLMIQEDDDDMMSQDSQDNIGQSQKPITGISSQGYNQVMHRIRGDRKSVV